HCRYGFFSFFSSWSRHTRWPRDWSSDVCSSDLYDLEVEKERLGNRLQREVKVRTAAGMLASESDSAGHLTKALQRSAAPPGGSRSEERRVGNGFSCGGT